MLVDVDFEAALDAAPDDWTLRLVYADRLDEAGEAALAAAQRWMARNRVTPVASMLDGSDETVPSWDWYTRQYGNGLPVDVHNALEGWAGLGNGGDPWPDVRHPNESGVKEYLSRAEAEAALADALARVGE